MPETLWSAPSDSPTEPVRILHLDDSRFDADLVAAEIRRNKFSAIVRYIQTESEYRSALKEKRFDLILSDYRMPGFDGDAALTLARKVCPEIPFIMVTGELGEDRAIETIKRGATDYVLKDNLRRLVPAMARALTESKNTDARLRVESQLLKRHHELEIIHRLAIAVGRAEQFDEIYREMFDTITEVTGVTRCSVLLYGHPDGRMHFTAWRSLSENYRRQVDGHSPWKPTDFAAEPIFVEDIDLDEPLASFRSIITDEGIRALAFLPLAYNDRLLGKFMVYFDTPHRFSPEEKQLLHTIGAHVAFAIGKKLAEDTLHQRELELTDFIQNAAVGIHWVDADGIIQWANKAELGLLGYREDEYVGHPISEFHADEPVINDILCRLTSGEEIYDYEARLRAKDGSVKHVQITSNVFRKNGAFVHTRCFTRDITEQKRAEEALRASEERLRAIILTLPVAVYMTDRQGRITLFNEEAVRLWGRRPEIGRELWWSPWKIYNTDGTPLSHEECPMAVALNEGRSVRGREIIVERQDGLKWNILPHPDPLCNASGEVIGGINVLVDISEQKQYELSRMRLAAIVHSSDDAILSKNLDGIITSWNGAAQRIFGYSAEEAIGNSINIIVPPEHRNEETAILECLRRGERVEHFDTLRLTKDGRMVAVSLSVSPLRTSTGEITGASTIARDVTERKQLEERLQHLNHDLEVRVAERTAQLQSALADMDAFTRTVTHDLRAPLRAASGYCTELVENESANLSRQGRHDINGITECIRNMEKLIEGLLQFARLGNRGVNKQQVSMRGVVQRAIQRAVKNDPSIVAAIKTENLRDAWADEVLVSQVFEYLISNAIKYSRKVESPCVEIGSTIIDGETVYYVKDNGVGFRDEDAEKLFVPFERLHADFEGVGIGLASAKRIIDAHGGRIWAKGVPESGAKFYFTLPSPEAKTSLSVR